MRRSASLLLLLGASALACAPLSPAVSVIDGCVSEHGYSCDWYAALEVAETGGCVEELRQHWSLAVRDACAGQADREVDIDIRLGNNDVHFASRPPSEAGGGAPPAIDERLAREFVFPKSGNHPQLDDRHDVTVLTSTRLGVLVGIYQGEWGGGLIRLPRRGEAQLLAREPVRDVFELGGRVYVIGGAR